MNAARPREWVAVVHYDVEAIAQCREGIERLMLAHSQEFTFYKDEKGRPDPDWATYELLEKNGRFRLVTARSDDGDLVGYFAIVCQRSLHYAVQTCFDDTFYLHPDYRGGWGLYSFVKRAVAEMEAMAGRGANLVVADKVRQDLGPIWKRLGFQVEEIRWTRMVK